VVVESEETLTLRSLKEDVTLNLVGVFAVDVHALRLGEGLSRLGVDQVDEVLGAGGHVTGLWAKQF